MLVLGNGKVITRDAACPFIEDGAVAVDGTTICRVGTTQDIRAAYPDAEYIDAKGGLIMPAFINVHEHIYSSFARGLSINGYNPNGFLDILDGMWWTIDRNLTLKDTYLSAMATYIDCIKCGVTTIFDHHASFGSIGGSLFEIEKAAKEAGVRSCLCYEISDRDGMDKARASVMENAEFIRHALKDDSGMIAGMMGMHAQFTISDETMELAAANKPDEVGYHIHVAEGIEDLHHCLKHYGKRIVDILLDHNILGEKTLLGHCIYINPHEMDLIKETDTMVVHNPESNMGNACGCPPTMELVHRGILTGLGTDGYTHDMMESFKPELGVLKEGAAGDVIIVAYDPLTPLNENNINGHLVFGVTGHDVVTTVANGKVLMKDRRLTQIDEAKVMADCRQAAKELAGRINSR